MIANAHIKGSPSCPDFQTLNSSTLSEICGLSGSSEPDSEVLKVGPRFRTCLGTLLGTILRSSEGCSEVQNLPRNPDSEPASEPASEVLRDAYCRFWDLQCTYLRHCFWLSEPDFESSKLETWLVPKVVQLAAVRSNYPFKYDRCISDRWDFESSKASQPGSEAEIHWELVGYMNQSHLRGQGWSFRAKFSPILS